MRCTSTGTQLYDSPVRGRYKRRMPRHWLRKPKKRRRGSTKSQWEKGGHSRTESPALKPDPIPSHGPRTRESQSKKYGSPSCHSCCFPPGLRRRGREGGQSFPISVRWREPDQAGIGRLARTGTVRPPADRQHASCSFVRPLRSQVGSICFRRPILVNRTFMDRIVLFFFSFLFDWQSGWRFVFRYGKRYETVDEIKLRFEIFSENLELIRSTNRKGLPYALAVNREFLSFFAWNRYGHLIGRFRWLRTLLATSAGG